MNPTVTYLRAGRSVRAKGRILRTSPETGLFRVKPDREKWKPVWLTINELQQGGNTPAPTHPHHIPAVGKMVDGLRQLLERKESISQPKSLTK